MTNLYLALTLTLVLTLGVVRHVDMVRTRSAARYLWSALALLAVAMLIKTLEVPFDTSDWHLIALHVLGILAVYCVFRICEHLLDSAPSRLVAWAMYVVVAFLVASVPLAAVSSVAWPIHWTLFSLYQGTAALVATVVCFRVSRQRTGIIRLELRLISAGSAVGVVYTLVEYLAHVPDTNKQLAAFSPKLLAVSLVLITLGTMGSPLYGRMRRHRDRDDLRRALMVIQPEWERVAAKQEEIVLAPPPNLLHIKDLAELRFWKTRMVIEIEGSLTMEG